MVESCVVLGVLDSGPDTLTPAARRRLQEADLVLGEGRFLDLFAAVMAPGVERRSTSGRLKELPQWIATARAEGRRVVLLATGDPLFSGVAAHLRHKLPAGAMEILPAPSLPQLAFSRLQWPWISARFVSLHSRDGGDWEFDAPPTHPLLPLLRLLPETERIAVLTSPANTPGRIARAVARLGWGEHFRITVAERLELEGERIVRDLTPDACAGDAFAEPNVALLQRASPFPLAPVLGLADEHFLPGGQGMMTRKEIRVLVLAALELFRESVVWDVGAGSGSVGLEAARLIPHGWVWAVERDAGRAARLRQNRAALGVFNHTLTEGEAPHALTAWPDPDRVFIGGSGGTLAALMSLALTRLRPGGRLVLALTALENLNQALALLAESGWSWTLTQAQLHHSRPLGGLHRLAPAAPAWILTAFRASKTLATEEP